MSRQAARKAAATADALEAFLRRRPAAAGPPAGAVPVAAPVASSPVPPDGRLAAGATAALLSGEAAAAAGGDAGRGAPLRLAHPDWLYHRLTVAGSPAALAAFQAAAAGPGIIPWQLDPDRLADDCFHLLTAPPPPQQRSLSLAGARILAGQLRDAAARRHDLALARIGHSRACPFDLHALLPVPGDTLRRGPDDPVALAWLWKNWGTTDALRHVTAERTAVSDRRLRTDAGVSVFTVQFWSADWSPWRALAQIAARWPALRFALRPSYDEAG